MATSPATEATRVTFDAQEHILEGLWTEATDVAVAVGVLAHGAGAGMTHPFLAGAARGLASGGVHVLRFDFPYVTQGRRSPDRPPVLLASWRGALAEGVRRANGLQVVAGGKSLGGRMASMLAAQDGAAFAARALVFFGYPLHAPGRPDSPRDAHLADVGVPMLFIQGTRDPLATFELMEALVARLGRRARLHPVDGGDHSFRVRGARRPDEESGQALGAVVAAFVRDVLG